ncbi:hypothetical protein BIW11_10217, partial [Tropilaelaps mercedesae]
EQSERGAVGLSRAADLFVAAWRIFTSTSRPVDWQVKPVKSNQPSPRPTVVIAAVATVAVYTTTTVPTTARGKHLASTVCDDCQLLLLDVVAWTAEGRTKQPQDHATTATLSASIDPQQRSNVTSIANNNNNTFGNHQPSQMVIILMTVPAGEQRQQHLPPNARKDGWSELPLPLRLFSMCLQVDSECLPKQRVAVRL